MTATVLDRNGEHTLWQAGDRWGISHATPGHGVSTFGLRCEALDAWRRITDPDYLARHLDSVADNGKRVPLFSLGHRLPGGLLADSIFGDTLDRISRVIEQNQEPTR